MNPTKEMIEAVEYMAETGKCLGIKCEILQTGAKNWLKENKLD